MLSASLNKTFPFRVCICVCARAIEIRAGHRNGRGGKHYNSCVESVLVLRGELNQRKALKATGIGRTQHVFH